MTAQTIAFWGFIVISTILLAFAAVVLWKIVRNEIPLADLLAEPPPPGQTTAESKASLSRFQFLIFTFVIAGLFLLLSIEAGTFVEIPTNVLALLGISGGSYVISKAVGKPGTPTGAQTGAPTGAQTAGDQAARSRDAAGRPRRTGQPSADATD